MKIWQTERSVPFTPETGKVYRNAGGGEFLCISTSFNGRDAIMQNTASGWTLIAHGIRRYSDGSIEWDYSTNGRFENRMVPESDRAEIRHRYLSLANAMLCMI